MSESLLSLLLHFLSRRLDQSPPRSTAARGFDSRRILREYAEREINLLLWFALFAITALLVHKVSKLLKLWSNGHRIPGPPCHSFYGHSVMFGQTGSKDDLIQLLLKSHEKYGSIVKLWLSPTQLLVSIKDPSLINDMLSKAADKLPLTGRVYRLAFGQSNFFVSSFEEVKKGRESLVMELNKTLLGKTNLMTDRALDSVMERVCAIMDEGTLDCRMFSQNMAFSILGATLFGDTFFTWTKANVYEEILIKIAKEACFWASFRIPPFWKRSYWKYLHLCKNLKILTQDLVRQCQMNYKLSYQSNCGKNSTIGRVEAAPLATHLSSVQKLEKLSSDEPWVHLNLLESCGNVMGMMFHGCLTTSALIGNIMARLVYHPEIQEKIHSEVVMVRRRSDKLNKPDVSEMKFLLATIYESARLLPTGPLLQRCSLKQDLELRNGMSIPAGAMLVAPIQLVQMDELNWGSDAGQFNPYRFLSKTESVDGVPPDLGDASYVLCDPFKNAAFLPFGSGIRACVGEKFAVLGLASLFASLLEQYQIKLCPGSNDDPKPLMVNSVLQLVPSPKIVFVRRDAS